MSIANDRDPAPTPWIVGETVPWSVAWTAEMDFSLQPSTDFPGLTDLVQAENPGEGVPRFAMNHISRNRRGLFRHLCHVCGHPTKSWDRWLFPVQTGGFVTLPDGQRRYAGNLPPTHKACAERSQRQCPRLSALFAVPVRFPKDDEGRMVHRTDVAAGLEGLARTFPRDRTIVTACIRLHGPRFSRAVMKLRQADATSAAGGVQGVRP